MSVDTLVLRIMRKRKGFDKYSRAIPPGVMNAQTTAIMKDYAKFFAEHKDVAEATAENFIPFFKLVHPKLSEDAIAIYDGLLRKVFEPGEPDVEAGLMDKIIALDGAARIMSIVEDFNAGGEVNLLQSLRTLADEMEADTVKKVKSVEVLTDIADMMKEDEMDTGLHWRLSCLNRSMRPLRGGDFGVIAGRPDKGKTSFLTSELSFMAQQLDTLYPGEGRSIIWFNNEGPGKRIKYRLYQSALNATVPEMVGWQQDGSLQQRYLDAIGGRADALRIFDIHDWWNWEVEDLLKTLKPALIVFDMIDNIKFAGGAANNGQRTDQLLEEMYKWGRNLSVKLDVPAMATSQISAAGDGLSYPTLAMLKDSQTGKQGACEFIITIGALNEITMQNSRFIGMTKNKLHKIGGPRDPRAEVDFDGLRGRYTMPAGGEVPE